MSGVRLRRTMEQVQSISARALEHVRSVTYKVTAPIARVREEAEKLNTIIAKRIRKALKGLETTP